MGALFQIIAYSLGNLFLGVILTIVGVVLMFVLIQSWRSNCTYTPLSYITGEFFFFFFLFKLYCYVARSPSSRILMMWSTPLTDGWPVFLQMYSLIRRQARMCWSGLQKSGLWWATLWVVPILQDIHLNPLDRLWPRSYVRL